MGKDRHDKTVVDDPLHKGELVLLKNKVIKSGQRKKTTQRQTGPFEILQLNKAKNSAELLDLKTKQMWRNTINLIRFNGDAIQGDDTYEIAEVLKSTDTKALVRFKGYPDSC